MERISATISTPQVEKLRVLVDAEQISMSEILRKAIDAYYLTWREQDVYRKK